MKTLFSGLISVFVFAVFMVLKLCKIIAWSWWWVCSPILAVSAIIVGVAVYAVYVLKKQKSLMKIR